MVIQSHACELFVYYIGGICHEAGLRLKSNEAIPSEIIQEVLRTNRDSSGSGYFWLDYADVPPGITFWVRKDDRFTFVTMEYRHGKERPEIRVKSEKRYSDQANRLPDH